MDPFLVQSSHPSLLRPATALQGDLAAVLREGRILAGEVLQVLDGGTLLIGIGTSRVPAHSQVEMQPGHRFRFRVESSGGATLLRVLGEDGGEEHELLRALRAVLDQKRPMGELLARLAPLLESALQRPAGGIPAEAVRELLGSLSRHALRPSGDGEELRAALHRSGFGYEAALAQLALDSGPRARVEAILGEIERGVLGAIASARPEVGWPAELRQALWEEVEALLGEGDRARLAARLEGGRTLGLARDLEQLLARSLRALDGAAGEAGEPGILEALRRAGLPALPIGLRRALLKSLLGLDPFDRAGARADPGAARAELESDLKGSLLRGLSRLPEGPLREAVASALAGIEAEQLLNLARREGQQPLHWTLALPDGPAWTSAHLSYRYFGGRARDGEAARDGAVHRVIVSVELSRTGPLRADLFVRSDSLTARLRVARAEVARRLRGRAAELEQRLAAGGRRVQLSIEEAPELELGAEEHDQDVRWLFEHHVMDLFG